MVTCVHVTHEAVEQSGGIGTVLRGLIVARAYQERVERTILLGPLPSAAAGGQADVPGLEVWFDSLRGAGAAPAAAALAQVASFYGVRLVHGRRLLGSDGREAWAEVLMVDVGRPHRREDEFKYYLYERFGLDSRRYEANSEYELFLRLADPGVEAVRALLGDSGEPCWLIAHEFMGLCTVLRAILGGDRRFRTAFYAHEVATARLVIEHGPGRDLAFYQVLRLARRTGGYLADHFGAHDWFYKHALVSRAWRCDAVLAVGDWVVEELRFLGPEFAGRAIDVVYNGIPRAAASGPERRQARARLRQFAAALLGWEPDWVFTHVTRLVRSKGLWRDLLVLRHLDARLAAAGQRAVLLVLASAAGPRPGGEVWRMAGEYGWPLAHREGYPDLTSGELDFDLLVRRFNASAVAVRVVFLNQFGFGRASCGPAVPEAMSFADLRLGTDAEFGQSLYEPFGIAVLEPLSSGAVCVASDVCGCVGFARRVLAGRPCSNLVAGEYASLSAEVDLAAAHALGPADCARVEAAAAARVAAHLAAQLPRTPQEQQLLWRQGQELASAMSWEKVVRDMLVPALRLG